MPLAKMLGDADPILEFQIGNRDEQVGRAVASSAVGLLALATLGVGWVSVPGRTLNRLRVEIHDQPAPPSYSITDQHGTTASIAAPELLYRLNDHLMPLELDLLLRRCLWGWQPPTDELLSIDFCDHEGNLIRRYSTKPDKENDERELKLSQGLNRLIWDTRYPDAESFDGLVMWSGSTRGPRAAPDSPANS